MIWEDVIFESSLIWDGRFRVTYTPRSSRLPRYGGGVSSLALAQLAAFTSLLLVVFFSWPDAVSACLDAIVWYSVNGLMIRRYFTNVLESDYFGIVSFDVFETL